MNTRISEALNATSETQTIEFKETFDPASSHDWCELLKDIFAIANSGGGVIVFGLGNNGIPVSGNMSAIAALDPAKYGDKIEAYTGVHFDQFHVECRTKNGKTVVCLDIQEAAVLLLPRRPGTYATPNGKKQDRAFSSGVLYVRHGAKSEPATSNDLKRLIDRRVDIARRDLLHNVRRVVAAPSGSTFEVLLPAKRSRRPKTLTSGHGQPQGPLPVRTTASPDAAPIRITSEPSAPAFHLVDPNRTHPYRISDMLQRVNAQLSPLGRHLSVYDIHAIDATHSLFSRLEFSYKPRYGVRTYSEECVEWIVDQIKRNQVFHILARSKWQRKKRGMR
jgi:hypothetical protein